METRMKWLRPIGLAAAMLTFGMTATAGDLSGYFGNTVECRYPNGDVTKVTTDADGTFTVATTSHPSSSGKWTDDGSTVCYNQTNPPPGAGQKPVCYSSQARKVGDTWTITDPFGAQCVAVLVAGRT